MISCTRGRDKQDACRWVGGVAVGSAGAWYLSTGVVHYWAGKRGQTKGGYEGGWGEQGRGVADNKASGNTLSEYQPVTYSRKHPCHQHSSLHLAIYFMSSELQKNYHRGGIAVRIVFLKIRTVFAKIRKVFAMV